MGKKGGSTTVQSYKPTEQEIRLQKQAADYAEAVAPNALWLNNVAQGLLKASCCPTLISKSAVRSRA